MATEDLGTLLLRVGITGAGETRSQVRGLGQDAIEAGRKVRGAGADIRSIEAPLLTAGLAITTFAANFRTVVGLLSGFSGVGIASQFQMAEVGLEGLLGNRAAAKTLLADLRAMAAVTPFDTAALSQMAGGMLATGFSADTLVGKMKAIADAAAALGHTQEGFSRIQLAIAQIRSSPTLQGDELRQLSEARVNIATLVNAATGSTFTNFAQAKAFLQTKSGEEVAEILLQGMERKFGGAAERMGMSTLVGVMVNAGEAIKNVMLPTGQLLVPVLILAGKTVMGVVNAIGKLNELTGGGAGLIFLIGGLVRAKGALIGSIIGAWQQINRLTAALNGLSVAAGMAAATTTVGSGAMVLYGGGKAGAGAAAGIGGMGGWWKGVMALFGAGGIGAAIRGGMSTLPLYLGGALRGIFGRGFGPIGIAAGLGGSIAGNMIGGPAGNMLGNVGMGVGVGSMFGPWGAAIGGILGLSKGIYEYFTSGDSAQERTAKATEQMAHAMQSGNLGTVIGGPRARSVHTQMQIEISLARMLGQKI